MKMLEKIWINSPQDLPCGSVDSNSIEYVRADVFIKKALKWYCLDCECNDNCKNTKCFFYREYEYFLQGKGNTIPPKFSDRILNEDGSTSDNWRYRHFVAKMQNTFIEKACTYLNEKCRKFILTAKDIEDFKNYMKESKI